MKFFFYIFYLSALLYLEPKIAQEFRLTLVRIDLFAGLTILFPFVEIIIWDLCVFWLMIRGLRFVRGFLCPAMEVYNVIHEKPHMGWSWAEVIKVDVFFRFYLSETFSLRL